MEGANAGNWVFFRLSTDADFANNERYFFRTADGAAALGDSALAPQINYTLIAIPEPGAALLIGAATMLFGIRRKR